MRKVGRPPLYLYEEERINSRREQNRNNQRNFRLKKKIYNDVKKISIQTDFNYKYQEDLVHSFMNYGFNTLFTGTINLSILEEEELILINKEIDKINQELQIELPYFQKKRTTIPSLRKYTEKYIQYLFSKYIIDRSLVFFEISDNLNVHTHIILYSNIIHDELLNIPLIVSQ